MTPLLVLACALAGPAPVGADLRDNLAQVRARAAALRAAGDLPRLAGLCEGALTVARPLIKGNRSLQRRVEVGLLLATRLPTVAEQASRLHSLLEEACDQLGVPGAKPVKPLPIPKEVALSDEESDLINRLNAERAKAGLRPLKPNPQLTAAARAHSRNMAAQGHLAHELDGKNFDKRVEDQGYTMRAGGENIAAGQRTPEEAMSSWMRSEGHRENILNPAFEEAGVAVATSRDGKRYWTQVFAAPLRR
jgi:uncharacterized protein YkwD